MMVVFSSSASSCWSSSCSRKNVQQQQIKRKRIKIFPFLIFCIIFILFLLCWSLKEGYRLIVLSDNKNKDDDDVSKKKKNHHHYYTKLNNKNEMKTMIENKILLSSFNSSSSSFSSSAAVIKIAHVVSLITCQKATRVVGFLDALIILRHSIHENSIHATTTQTTSTSTTANNTSFESKKSKYSYQMIAFIHEDGGCVQYVPLLKRLGYIPIVKPTPVNITAITNPEGQYYKTHVENENCCGSKEFIKLYAYTLTDYPIVVHWDLDVAVLQPMDHLYDAMIYPYDNIHGIYARSKLQLQRPESQKQLPIMIDAFYTLDITSSKPWEAIQAVQGGFLVARPNIDHFRMYQEFISKADYKPGRGTGSGWGGLGYGGFQGAMAYQGVLAYFYNVIYPGRAVSLDVCRWNQVVADIIWRGPDAPEYIGQCRQHPADNIRFEQNKPIYGQCEDCRIIPVDQINTVHYTACKKPWECKIPYPRIPSAKMKKHKYRLQELTNVTTCGLLFHKYFQYRYDIESKILSVTNRKGERHDGQRNFNTGKFHPEFFLGYCNGSGRYISLEQLIPENFDMKVVYGL